MHGIHLNAFTKDLTKDLVGLLRHAKSDPHVKALILSGGESHIFSSGMHLNKGLCIERGDCVVKRFPPELMIC